MTKANEPIHIMFCCDSGFLEVTRLAVAAAANSVSACQSIHAHVALDHVASDAKQHFANSLKRCKNLTVNMIDVSDELLDQLPSLGRWTRVSNIRLHAEAVLHPSVHKVIYLDGDAFPFGDLEELWSVDLEDKGLGGCRDAVRPTMRHRLAAFGDQPLPGPWARKSPEQPHINAGVLLIDVDHWRRTGFAQRAMELMAAYPQALDVMDQDVLNLLFDNLVVIDPKWNVQLGAYGWLRLREQTCDYESNVGRPYQELIDDPGIIHFCGNRPWQGMSLGQFRHYGSSGYFYWKAVQASGLYSQPKKLAMLAYHLTNGIRMSAKDYRHRRRFAKQR